MNLFKLVLLLPTLFEPDLSVIEPGKYVLTESNYWCIEYQTVDVEVVGNRVIVWDDVGFVFWQGSILNKKVIGELSMFEFHGELVGKNQIFGWTSDYLGVYSFVTMEKIKGEE